MVKRLSGMLVRVSESSSADKSFGSLLSRLEEEHFAVESVRIQGKGKQQHDALLELCSNKAIKYLFGWLFLVLSMT